MVGRRTNRSVPGTPSVSHHADGIFQVQRYILNQKRPTGVWGVGVGVGWVWVWVWGVGVGVGCGCGVWVWGVGVGVGVGVGCGCGCGVWVWGVGMGCGCGCGCGGGGFLTEFTHWIDFLFQHRTRTGLLKIYRFGSVANTVNCRLSQKFRNFLW